MINLLENIDIEKYKLNSTKFDLFLLKKFNVNKEVTKYLKSRFISSKVNPIGILYRKGEPAFLVKEIIKNGEMIVVEFTEDMRTIYTALLPFKENFLFTKCAVNWREITPKKEKEVGNKQIKGDVKFLVKGNKVIVKNKAEEENQLLNLLKKKYLE